MRQTPVFDPGIDTTPLSFVVYFDAREPWCSALISASMTGEIVFGLSVNDPLNEPAQRMTARDLLAELRLFASATHGWIKWEMPPPFQPLDEGPWADSDVLLSFHPGSDFEN